MQEDEKRHQQKPRLYLEEERKLHPKAISKRRVKPALRTYRLSLTYAARAGGDWTSMEQ